MDYKSLNRDGLQTELKKCRQEYEALKAQGLKLDMSRGTVPAEKKARKPEDPRT